MGLIPGGASEITAPKTYGLTGDPSVGPTAPGLPGRTQGPITDQLKASQVNNGTSVWSKPTGYMGQLAAILGPGAGFLVSLFSGLSTAATNAINALNQLGALISHVGGAIITDVSNAINSAVSNANTALTNITSLAASLLGTPESVIGNLQHAIIDGTRTIQNWFDSLGSAFGGASSGNTVASVGTAASSVASTASSANTNASTAITNADSAQTTASSAQIGVSSLAAAVSALQTGGASASDTFDRASSTDLGSDYSQGYTGPGTSGLSGSGVLCTDGAGNAVWQAGSSTTGLRGYAAYITSGMSSDYQMASMVLATKPQSGAGNYLILRMDTSGNGVYAGVHNSTISFGRIASGVFTQLDSQSASIASGDLWEFWIGTSTSAREYVLRRNNGSTVYTFTESGTTSLMGASYRDAGLGMNFPGGFGTPLPGKIGVFSFADRNP